MDGVAVWIGGGDVCVGECVSKCMRVGVVVCRGLFVGGDFERVRGCDHVDRCGCASGWVVGCVRVGGCGYVLGCVCGGWFWT